MINKKIFYNTIGYAVCLGVSYLLIYSSLDRNSWMNLWNYANIPTMWPAFADIDHISRSVLSKMSGYDPFEYNPFEISGTRYQYPTIWLHIFEKLNLQIKQNFNLFMLFSISFYLFAFFNLFLISKNYFSRILIILLFFSTSNFLLLERGNIDHIIFYLIFLVGITNNLFIGMLIMFICSMARIYPIFSFLIFFKKKKNIILSYLLIGVVIFLTYEIMNLRLFNPNHVWMAIIPAYGSMSITEAIFHLLKDYEIIEFTSQIKTIIRFSVMLIFLFISTYFFILGQRNEERPNMDTRTIRLFTLGSCIYVGSYIFFSNIDYRLVFLFFAVPYMLEKKNTYSIVFTICILISSYSWYFSIGHPLSFIYAINAIFVYAAKLILFLILNYELGKINKNFFYNIFFLRKKDLKINENI